MLLRELDLVVKGTPLTSREALFCEIEQFKPHVILLDHSLQSSEFISSIFSLNEFPDIRLMVINSENNLVHVLDKYQIEVTRGKDLLNALRWEAKIS
jgi:hypothetical protein